MAGHGNGATRLGQMLYLWRTVNRLSLRDVEDQTGISNVTIMRIEHGHLVDAKAWLKLQAWLFEQVGPETRSRAVKGGR